jgi:DNA-binding transcriptional regulator GbsR (MarR family)
MRDILPSKDAIAMARKRKNIATKTSAAERALDQSTERFIALWGQMGTNWGVPRTMAEIHALLFISDAPINAEDIALQLDMSRGNVSMSLRALVEWGIVRKTSVQGDRKDFYEAEQDVMQLFRAVLRERKRREIEPLLEELNELVDTTSDAKSLRVDEHTAALKNHARKLDRLRQFVELVNAVAEHLIDSTDDDLKIVAKLFARAS